MQIKYYDLLQYYNQTIICPKLDNEQARIWKNTSKDWLKEQLEIWYCLRTWAKFITSSKWIYLVYLIQTEILSYQQSLKYIHEYSLTQVGKSQQKALIYCSNEWYNKIR
jgi:hypothetical protein